MAPRKIWLTLAGLSGLLALSGLVLFWVSWEIEQDRGRREDALHRMESNVHAVGAGVLHYLRIGSFEPGESFTARRESFERALAAYRDESPSREAHALAIKLEHSFRQYVELAEQLVRRRDEQTALVPELLEGWSLLEQLGTDEPARGAGLLGNELRGAITEAAGQWAAYQQTFHSEFRERARERVRAAESVLARLPEAAVSTRAGIQPLLGHLQTAFVLEDEQREQLERFDALRGTLVSDLKGERAIDGPRRGSPWAMAASAGLLLGALVGWSALAFAMRPAGARNAQIEGSGEELDRQREWFLSMLAHELRNPLAPIRSAVQILELSPPADPKVVQLRDVIGRQVRQLERLIDDLMDVSRIRRGLVELRTEKMDLVELIRETAGDYEGPLAERQIQLELAVPDGPVWILGDRTRITQVVGNLLQNSAKFTNPGGKVQLELRAQAGQAVLELRDSGIGMGQSTLDAIFQPFRQGKRAAQRPNGGLGIGLALVKGLVDLHGGEVEATSKGKGRGSAFAVRLPIAR